MERDGHIFEYGFDEEPPLHPNCNCVIEPMEDSDLWDIEYDNAMSYYIEDNNEDDEEYDEDEEDDEDDEEYGDEDWWNYMYGIYDYGNKSDSAIMELKCKLIELKKLINQ